MTVATRFGTETSPLSVTIAQRPAATMMGEDYLADGAHTQPRQPFATVCATPRLQ